MSPCRIRPAVASDLNALPAIERDASGVYRDYLKETGLTEQSLTYTNSVEQFTAAWKAELLWILADDADAPVGFAMLRQLDEYTLYLHEFDVHPMHARRGLGRRLLEHVCDAARDRHARAITLMTYRDVPWNMPFYQRCGFRVLVEAEWTPALLRIREEERALGWCLPARVVMQRELGGGRI